MKRIIALLLTVCMVLCLASCGKKESEAVGIKVYVSISTAGTLQLAAKEVTVEDIDSNGIYTLDEALLAAHKQYCPDGEKAYISEEGAYGLAISMLWNDANGMSGYGYYINNLSATNLSDEVKEEDYVYAYSYKDLTNWSDNYTYFDTLFVTAGNDITVHLNKAGFDQNWAPIVVDAVGCNVYVGNLNVGTTDNNGDISFSVNGTDSILVTAEDPNAVIVPPVCYIVAK